MGDTGADDGGDLREDNAWVLKAWPRGINLWVTVKIACRPL